MPRDPRRKEDYAAMKTRKIALLTALLLCLSACGSSVPEQDAPVVASAAVTSDGGDTESPAEPKPDAGEKSLLPSDAPLAEAEAAVQDSVSEGVADCIPQVDIIAVERSFDAGNGTQLVHYARPDITVTIPDRPEAEEQIQFDLDNSLQLTSDEQLETQAQEDYDWAQEAGMTWITYCDELDAEVVRADSHVLSLRVDVYTYTGGVHGYYYSYGISYDAETGERLGLKNLSAGVTDLSSYVRNIILTLCQTEEYKDLLYEDYKPYINDVIQDSHFYFTDDGLTFVAEPYLLGPYAAGQIEFPISYEDLSGVVKDIYLK